MGLLSLAGLLDNFAPNSPQNGLLAQQGAAPGTPDAAGMALPPGLLMALQAQASGQGAQPTQGAPPVNPTQGGAPMQAAPPPAAQIAQAAPQQPPVPQMGPRGAVGDILDNLLLGGTIQKTRQAEYQRQLQNYQLQQSAAAMQNLTPAQRVAAIFNGPEFGKAEAQNFAPVTMKQGETTNYGGPTGPQVTAPIMGVDEKSGVGFTQRPTGIAPTGQFGGDYTAANGLITSGRTGGVAGTYSTPQNFPASNSYGGFTPTVSGPGGAPAPGPAAPPPAGGQGAPLDAAAFYKSFIAPHEGGLNPSDMNGSPTNMGFNQKANPDINVKNLTPDQAAQRFATNYYGPSGAANLPPALAAVHADTYFINPKVATSILAQSGGDPQKYMQLRQSWMQNMVQNNPAAAPYAKAWAQRNTDLSSLANSLGGAQGAPQQQGQGGFQGLTPGKTMGPPQAMAGLPGQYQVKPDGSLVHIDGTGLTPKDALDMGKDAANDKSVLAAQESGRAFNSMQALAAQPPGGMRAYALRDTFARTINPGAVARVGTIEAIKQAQGIPAQMQAYFMNLKGDGDVPPQIVQQILTAAAPFAQSAWDQANQVNQRNAAIAQRNGLDPQMVTAPLDPRPALPNGPIRTVSSPAEATALPPGTRFRTPDGRVKVR